jgi:hypothetical protein
MFIANFDSRGISDCPYGVSVTFIDFLIAMVSNKILINRLEKRLNKNFRNDTFRGVNYYGKK